MGGGCIFTVNGMPDQGSSHPKGRIKKWLIWILVSGVFCGVLLGGGVLPLPTLVSTQWFRHWAEQKASETLRRPVHIGALTWTWSQGLILKDLEIPDDPALSRTPLLSLARLSLGVEIAPLMRQELVFSLSLEGIKANWIRTSDGRTNLDTLLANLTHP